MEAQQLWKELHDLFDTDDGSLPEIQIQNLSSDEVITIFDYLKNACHHLSNNARFWSVEDQESKPINFVPNAAALVTQGRAEPFHVLCHGLSYGGEVIPDLGVFVFDDQISLDYRMGAEWNAARLKALFGTLRQIKQLAPAVKIGLEKNVLREVGVRFEVTWKKYLEAANNV
jgi:hypothetical protein